MLGKKAWAGGDTGQQSCTHLLDAQAAGDLAHGRKDGKSCVGALDGLIRDAAGHKLAWDQGCQISGQDGSMKA